MQGGGLPTISGVRFVQGSQGASGQYIFPHTLYKEMHQGSLDYKYKGEHCVQGRAPPSPVCFREEGDEEALAPGVGGGCS